MKKILVINVNWLGDVIFSTPALKALRQNNKNAHITCVVVARCQEILKNNPAVNEIVVYDEYGKHRSLWRKYKFIRMLRKKKFDEMYVLHQSLKRAMIGYLAGIPKRIGYETKGRRFLLSQAVPVPEKPLHKIDYFLNLLKASGIESEDRMCEFFISPEDEKKAELLLVANGIEPTDEFVVFNPGGNWLLKRWPVTNFSDLGNLLVSKQKLKVLIAGAKKDIELAQQIARGMDNKPIVLTGTTTLHQLAAIMKKARCVVTADSGPMHIARAAGASIIAIFGPTDSELTGPVGSGDAIILQKDEGCPVPCYKLDCEDNRCMQAITTSDVYNAVLKILR